MQLSLRCDLLSRRKCGVSDRMRLHPGADLSQNGNYGGRFLPRFVSACESTEIAGEAAEIVP